MITGQQFGEQQHMKAKDLKDGQMGIDRDGDYHFKDSCGKHFIFRLAYGWMEQDIAAYTEMTVTALPAGSTITITSEV